MKLGDELNCVPNPDCVVGLQVTSKTDPQMGTDATIEAQPLFDLNVIYGDSQADETQDAEGMLIPHEVGRTVLGGVEGRLNKGRDHSGHRLPQRCGQIYCSTFQIRVVQPNA